MTENQTMTGRVTPVAELRERDEVAWHELAARAVEPNPLFEPDCLIPAARHLANGAAINLVIASEGPDWFGCFPVQRLERWRAIRRPIYTTGVRRMYYDGSPLLDAGRGDESARSLLEALIAHARSGAPGLIVFDWLDDGPAASLIEQACTSLGLPSYRYHSWVRPVLHRRATMNYRSDHNTLLKKLGRLRRNLAKREQGEVCLVDRSDDESIVETVIELESAGYKRENGVAMTLHAGEPEWFREMCDRFRRDKRVHAYALQAGTSTVAAQLFIRGGNRLFLLKLVYDERFAEFRPGIQLQLDGIDQVHEATDAEWIDTCTYEGNQTLLHLYPDRRAVTSLVVAVGGPLDRGLLRSIRLARRAKERLSRRTGQDAR